MVLRRPPLVRRVRLGLWALAGLCVAASRPASAGPPEPSGGVEFAWDAPSDACPSEAEVVVELERLLGGPVSEQGDR